ncbi:DEAD/DEAH box helicase [Entamoeba marina]
MKRGSNHTKRSKQDNDDIVIEQPIASKQFIKPNDKPKTTPTSTTPIIPESPMPDENPGSFDRTDPPLSPEAQAMLKKRDITSLFPIQVATYSPVYYHRDVIGKAQTGSGKTISFSLPLMEKFRANKHNNRNPKILCLSPTRELAVQIEQEFKLCACGIAKTICLYGGVDISNQIRSLDRGIDVVVGTPGRVIDHIQRRSLLLKDIETIVLDEADEMLNIGFQEEITKILDEINESRKQQPDQLPLQTLLFSATMPKWVAGITKKYLREDAVTVDVAADVQVPKNAKHFACNASSITRPYVIANLIRVYANGGRVIVFCDTKKECTDLSMTIMNTFECQQLHGDIAQTQREQTLKGFREDKFSVLVATDVAARGLDISGVDLIIMTHVPKDIPQYVHRAGRTARAGKEGTTITIYSRRDLPNLETIESKIGVSFVRVGVPQLNTLAQASTNTLISDIHNIEEQTVDLFRGIANDLLKEGDAEDVLARVIATLQSSNITGDIYSLLASEKGYRTICIEYKYPVNSFTFIKNILKDTLEEAEVDRIGETVIHDNNFLYMDLPESIADKFIKSKRRNNGIVSVTIPDTLPDTLGIHKGKTDSSQRGGYGDSGRRDYGRRDYGRRDYGKRDYGRRDFNSDGQRRDDRRDKYRDNNRRDNGYSHNGRGGFQSNNTRKDDYQRNSNSGKKDYSKPGRIVF